LKRHLLIIPIILLSSFIVHAQNYIDTVYNFKTIDNVHYGTSIDVAGNARNLMMDISYPGNDTIKPCGRPLMIIVHGGAFIAGDKSESSITRMRQEFAMRGYVTAAVNYRLGMFHTDKLINCNVSSLGLNWNCLNMTDSSEWYRSYYRGIQDVHGAIRYFANNQNLLNVNMNNVYVVGESAGGFIAMGVGFIDDTTEVLRDLTKSLSNVYAPNKIYENDCIISLGLDTSIASMKLGRPDLGYVNGTLNPPIPNNYTIRGVGNFYGGCFNNIFVSHSAVTPVLYTFHQPNDLIVPYNVNRVFAGFNECAMGFPFNCQSIISRPIIYGSKGITSLIDSAELKGKTVPRYQFDRTTNNANCLLQASNPSLSGHAVDNFNLRQRNMATFFATAMDTCRTNGISNMGNSIHVVVYPNPGNTKQSIHIDGFMEALTKISLIDFAGNHIQDWLINKPQHNSVLDLNGENIHGGVYILNINNGVQSFNQRIILIN
jgi:hypothetical protein